MFKKKKVFSNDLVRRLITREQPKSPISEQYRTIRTNIEFSMVDKELKTLMCTSANPSEGKTTTVANLAVSFAQQGKKVLLVDGDLRKPSVHHRFQADNRVGLTGVLTKKTELEKAIVATDIENLWFLSSGPIPPNPAELLGSKAMKELIEVASATFDMIIFDAPPVLAVTDAGVLGHIVDGTLLVVKANSTKKEELQKTKDLLDKASVNLIGSVLHGVEKTEGTYYYYYGK